MTLYLISLSQSTGVAKVINMDTGKAIAEFQPDGDKGGASYKAREYCEANGLQTIN